jgi:protein phosphatase
MPQIEALVFDGLSDTGQVRTNNEDTFIIPSDDDPRTQQLGYLFAVADGMGGYGGGQDASQTTLHTLYEQFYATPADRPAPDGLRNAVQAANMAVRRLSMEPGRDSRMGTTLVAVLVYREGVLITHVGDSRAYLVRSGHIVQLTADHSLVQEKVDAGLLNAEQARDFPGKNVLTRSVGSEQTAQADYRLLDDVQPDDVLVLCSDGLTNMVEDHEIGQVAAQQHPEAATRALVQLANDRGGPDNITVVIIRFVAPPGAEQGTPPPAQAAPAPTQEAPTPPAPTDGPVDTRARTEPLSPPAQSAPTQAATVSAPVQEAPVPAAPAAASTVDTTAPTEPLTPPGAPAAVAPGPVEPVAPTEPLAQPDAAPDAANQLNWMLLVVAGLLLLALIIIIVVLVVLGTR